MERTIDGPAGRVELRVATPPGQPRAVAVICHPHPLHGGSLNNKVVHQMARTFSGLGAVCVRFNFRGVGRSEGRFDNGDGETEDLISVVSWARRQWPGVPLWLAGFSFGAYVALRAAAELRPDWLVSVAPPVNLYVIPAPDSATPRWLVLQGEDDDIVPAADVAAWAGAQPLKPELVTLEAAGHFFHGRLNDLRAQIEAHAPVRQSEYQ